jgi:hypothetical protein
MKRKGPGIVDPRSFHQFARNGQEELAEQEGRGGRCHQRQGQTGIGIDQAEIDDNLVGRQDADLHRQHQRDEDHPEKDHAEREAEKDDSEGRQERDDDLADGNRDGHDEGVEQQPFEADADDALDTAGHGFGIVFSHVTAGQQRHGRTDDRLQVVVEAMNV